MSLPKLLLIALLFTCNTVLAQHKYFNASSPQNLQDAGYGKIVLKAEGEGLLINTIMAYGEKVTGLIINMPSGASFKLAPAQAGSNLNYVGSTLNIFLKAGEKATIEFSTTAKQPGGVQQLYVSGEKW
jgi:hypothetical protein